MYALRQKQVADAAQVAVKGMTGHTGIMNHAVSHVNRSSAGSTQGAGVAGTAGRDRMRTVEAEARRVVIEVGPDCRLCEQRMRQQQHAETADNARCDTFETVLLLLPGHLETVYVGE